MKPELPPPSLEIQKQSFSLEMWNEGVDIPAIDAFLETGPLPDIGVPIRTADGRPAGIDDTGTRAALMDERSKAFEAYTRGEYALAVALAVGLQRACQLAGFVHVVEPHAIRGVKHSRAQGARRRDKPGVEGAYDQSRNDRIRAYHARLVSVGASNATRATADEFGLSDRQIRNIVNAGRKQPG
ncbi:MAG: hypothetical protein H3C59_14000 [Burkholderiaceae bacterium]|nr:hypothetical protein [Burkholderiaceae bacterium]